MRQYSVATCGSGSLPQYPPQYPSTSISACTRYRYQYQYSLLVFHFLLLLATFCYLLGGSCESCRFLVSVILDLSFCFFVISRSSWGATFHLEKVREVKRRTPGGSRRSQEGPQKVLEGPQQVSRRSREGQQLLEKKSQLLATKKWEGPLGSGSIPQSIPRVLFAIFYNFFAEKHRNRKKTLRGGRSLVVVIGHCWQSVVISSYWWVPLVQLVPQVPPDWSSALLVQLVICGHWSLICH